MICYSIEPRDIKSIGKNISKNSRKILDHTKKSATDTLKTTSKRLIQTTTEATRDLNGNEITNKIAKISRTSPHNRSEIVTVETENTGFDREIPK